MLLGHTLPTRSKQQNRTHFLRNYLSIKRFSCWLYLLDRASFFLVASARNFFRGLNACEMTFLACYLHIFCSMYPNNSGRDSLCHYLLEQVNKQTFPYTNRLHLVRMEIPCRRHYILSSVHALFHRKRILLLPHTAITAQLTSCCGGMIYAFSHARGTLSRERLMPVPINAVATPIKRQ